MYAGDKCSTKHCPAVSLVPGGYQEATELLLKDNCDREVRDPERILKHVDKIRILT